jgi:hypothetical protein
MHDVVNIRLVGNIDVNLLTFANAQERPRDRAAIGECVYDLSGGEFEPQRSDAKRVVRRIRRLTVGARQTGTDSSSSCSCTDHESAAVDP